MAPTRGGVRKIIPSERRDHPGDHRCSDVGIGKPSDDGPDREVGRSERPFPLHSGGGGRAFLPEEWTPVLARRRGGDRKRKRMYSSHLGISYYVFWLK